MLTSDFLTFFDS